jgi:cobalamin biosynthesis protein CobT
MIFFPTQNGKSAVAMNNRKSTIGFLVLNKEQIDALTKAFSANAVKYGVGKNKPQASKPKSKRKENSRKSGNSKSGKKARTNRRKNSREKPEPDSDSDSESDYSDSDSESDSEPDSNNSSESEESDSGSHSDSDSSDSDSSDSENDSEDGRRFDLENKGKRRGDSWYCHKCCEYAPNTAVACECGMWTCDCEAPKKGKNAGRYRVYTERTKVCNKCKCKQSSRE